MEGLYEKTGRPFKGRDLKQIKALLEASGLRYGSDPDFTAALYTKDHTLAATGSLSGNILKYVAVAPQYQGEGLLAKILTALCTEANLHGISHLFLYTKPQNKVLFEPLGFYTVAQTQEVLLMENIRDGIGQYVIKLKKESAYKTGATVGAVVANCNPFTRGHRYLIEQAAKNCDLLHLFILTDGKIPESIRLDLVKEGTQDIKNLVLHKTEDYLVSRVTFPDYFMKDKLSQAWYDLDIAVFCTHIAPGLEITRRFAGTEPSCAVTGGYNEALKTALPKAGIQFFEIDRMTIDGEPVSASAVRRYIKEGKDEAAKRMIFPEMWRKIKEYYG